MFLHTGLPIRGETGDTACDSTITAEEDIELLIDAAKPIASLAWTRARPHQRHGLERKKPAYYDSLVNTLLEAGIKPYIRCITGIYRRRWEKDGWQMRTPPGVLRSRQMAEHFKAGPPVVHLQ